MDYKTIVSDAAKWLDSVEPGWWRRIDRDRLFIGSCVDCLYGQLYGSLYEGAKRHHGYVPGETNILYCEDTGTYFGIDNAEIYKAFDAPGFFEKTQLWLAEIQSRLAIDEADKLQSFITETNRIINQKSDNHELVNNPQEALYALQKGSYNGAGNRDYPDNPHLFGQG